MFKTIIKQVFIGLKLIGFDAIKFFNFNRGLFFYIRDYSTIKKQSKGNADFKKIKPLPILDDKFKSAGTMSGHYFHQDLHVARRIFKSAPSKHVDIGSRVDGFIAHVAVFREIEVFDIRKNNKKVQNIAFRQQDLMALTEDMRDYCDSISSLHAIEHFGLGRYGDPVDFFGHLKAITNIHSMLKKGGTFYFSTPIGGQRIEFNGQRVFSVAYLLDILNEKFEIIHFSFVDDHGEFNEHVELSDKQIKNNFLCNNGCGVFELKKI